MSERTANKGEEEVLAIAKEMGLDFTSDELKEAAGSVELNLAELESAAGGTTPSWDRCPARGYGGAHNWVLIAHEEDEWFGWLKDGGLFTIGYNTYKCTYCNEIEKLAKI